MSFRRGIVNIVFVFENYMKSSGFFVCNELGIELIFK